VPLRSISRVNRPKIHFVKYRYLHFLLKFIYIFIFVKDMRCDLRFDFERFEILKRNGDSRFEIWLNDFNPFLERFEIRVKDLI